RILLIASTVATVCAGAVAVFSLRSELFGLAALYATAFITGVTRGFAEPALSALEAQIVPRPLFVEAATVQASVWQGCAIVGPALGGLALFVGPTAAYAMSAVLFAGATLAVRMIIAPPQPPAKDGESI